MYSSLKIILCITPALLMTTSCIQQKTVWACQALMKKPKYDMKSMNLYNEFYPISISVEISDEKISLNGHVELVNMPIENDCFRESYKIPASNATCRWEGKITINSINGDIINNFVIHENTGVFSYSEDSSSGEGVCRKI